jgi:uncharacterized protein YabE (DUF348 family)
VTIHLDGEPRIIQSRALTVRQALQDAGLTITSADSLSPAVNQWLGWNAAVAVKRARLVQVWNQADKYPFQMTTRERLPANILAAARIQLYPGDRVLWNGMPVDPLQPLPPAEVYTLQYVAGKTILLHQEDRTYSLSSAGTLGDLLFEHGLGLTTADHVSTALTQAAGNVEELDLRQAAPLHILVNNTSIQTFAAAASVGEALAQAGVPLQGLDYSVPEADAPLPENGEVRVVHVREEILLTQDTIPFEKSLVADPELELDQTQTLDSGQYGVQVSRERVRYEDGQEVNRETEAEWVAKEPVPQQIGYGTKVVVRTTSTPDGTIEYWRAITVYATSYSPCRSGTEKCYYGTASGMKVQKGVIGVSSAWFSWMQGQRVYVPGYGFAVIADTGGGIPGKDWIDLGYSDEDYQAWHQNVTMYFLTPIPASIPWTLP